LLFWSTILAKSSRHLTLARGGAYAKQLAPGDCDSSDACIRLSDGRVIFYQQDGGKIWPKKKRELPSELPKVKTSTNAPTAALRAR